MTKRNHLACGICLLTLSITAYAGWSSSIGNVFNKAGLNIGKTAENAVYDTGDTLEKAVYDTGDTLEKTVYDIGDTLEKAVYDIGDTLEKTTDVIGDSLQKVAQDIGTPLPSNMELVGVTKTEEIRGKDSYGLGYFLSPRSVWGNDGDRIGTRYHGAIDFVTVPGEPIFSPIDGKIVRISDAYTINNHGLKAVVIEKNGYVAKVLYVKPSASLKRGREVKSGEIIGVAQDLGVKFEGEMINHVHLAVFDQEGHRVLPNNKWLIKPR